MIVMLTFAEILAERTARLAVKLKRFLLELSSLTDGSDTFRKFARMGVFAPSIAIFPGRWGKLSDEGLRVQAELLKETNELTILFGVAVSGLPSIHRELDDVKHSLVGYITHDRTPHTSTAAVWTNAERQIQQLNKMARFLAGSGSGRTLVIPDTNALYANTALDQWAFPEVKSFALCLVPAVLGEIDDHYHAHPNEAVRKKAAGLRSRFKEYGRRGDISSGVPIVTGKIEFRAFPTSKAFDLASPGTLDPSKTDDQVISSALDLIRRFPGDNVQIVTSDILMQVKLRSMGLPFVEPPVSNSDSAP
jgi:hypothetical protein